MRKLFVFLTLFSTLAMAQTQKAPEASSVKAQVKLFSTYKEGFGKYKLVFDSAEISGPALFSHDRNQCSGEDFQICTRMAPVEKKVVLNFIHNQLPVDGDLRLAVTEGIALVFRRDRVEKGQWFLWVKKEVSQANEDAFIPLKVEIIPVVAP